MKLSRGTAVKSGYRQRWKAISQYKLGRGRQSHVLKHGRESGLEWQQVMPHLSENSVYQDRREYFWSFTLKKIPKFWKSDKQNNTKITQACLWAVMDPFSWSWAVCHCCMCISTCSQLWRRREDQPKRHQGWHKACSWGVFLSCCEDIQPLHIVNKWTTSVQNKNALTFWSF